MATLITPQNGKAVKGRTKKSIPGVDLTAMVDLAFLLITFFMLTTALTKMKAMELDKPVPVSRPEDLADYPASRTMTILLGKNNQAAHYMGEAEKAAMKITGMAEIKKEILANKLLVAKSHADAIGKQIIIIIKPTDGSTYKNFIDILDEMNINGIEKYALDDHHLLKQEKTFMVQGGI